MWWLIFLWFVWLLVYGIIDSVKSSKKEKARIEAEKKLNAEYDRNYDNKHTLNPNYSNNTNNQKNDWILENQSPVKTWESYWVKQDKNDEGKKSYKTYGRKFPEYTKYSHAETEYVLCNWTVMTREEAAKASTDNPSKQHRVHVNKIRDDLLKQEREMYNDQ